MRPKNKFITLFIKKRALNIVFSAHCKAISYSSTTIIRLHLFGWVRCQREGGPHFVDLKLFSTENVGKDFLGPEKKWKVKVVASAARLPTECQMG
jgi:hypothetical protein